MHDSTEPQGHYASATFVRNSVLNGDMNYLGFVPSYTARMIEDRIDQGKTATLRRLERVALYRMRTITEEEMMVLPDMTEALCNRFYAARNSAALDELLAAVKTRCYTMSRIRRAVMCAMIGIRREALKVAPPYARVLAFNDRGRELMGIAQKKSRIPIHTSLAKLREENAACKAFVKMEERASNVYGLAQREATSSEEDYRARIIKGNQA
jgi:predicted nucleotidyltransferase